MRLGDHAIVLSSCKAANGLLAKRGSTYSNRSNCAMTGDMCVLPSPPCATLTHIQGGVAGVQSSNAPTRKRALEAPRYEGIAIPLLGPPGPFWKMYLGALSRDSAGFKGTHRTLLTSKSIYHDCLAISKYELGSLLLNTSFSRALSSFSIAYRG